VVGDKWEMYIPYELAYGAQGKPPKIPPAACLVFVMEICKIKGDKVAKKMVFPEWSAAELELWLPADQEACDKWKADRVTKWEAGDEKLRAKYPTREDLDAWVDATCDNSRNKSLWKRTRKKKSDGTAAAPSPRAVPAPLTAASARALLTKAMAAFVEPSNKATLLGLIKECEDAPKESAGMMKMMKLMPAVHKMLSPILEAEGYQASELMTVMMQIQAFGEQDPTIAADTEKLMKAVQGDLSDLV